MCTKCCSVVRLTIRLISCNFPIANIMEHWLSCWSSFEEHIDRLKWTVCMSVLSNSVHLLIIHAFLRRWSAVRRRFYRRGLALIRLKTNRRHLCPSQLRNLVTSPPVTNIGNGLWILCFLWLVWMENSSFKGVRIWLFCLFMLEFADVHYQIKSSLNITWQCPGMIMGVGISWNLPLCWLLTWIWLLLTICSPFVFCLCEPNYMKKKPKQWIQLASGACQGVSMTLINSGSESVIHTAQLSASFLTW